jgi:hypothetical protein
MRVTTAALRLAAFAAIVPSTEGLDVMQTLTPL